MSVRRILRSDHVVGWAFAFPAVALIVAFGIVPIVWSALMSFQKTNLLSTPEWIGFDNYRALPKDPLFKTSIVHAMIYTALFVPLSVGGGLFAAVALNRHIRGIRLYRLAVFVPVVVSTIATSIMFLWLFDPNFGLANWLLGKVGLGPFGFFTSSDGALYSIIAMTVWGWIGFDAIIYLAALQGVPKELLEAGGDRRCADVEHLPQRHAAAARPGDALPRGLLDDQRDPGVRRGVLPDEGRAGDGHVRARCSTSSRSRSSRASRATRQPSRTCCSS